MKIEDKHGRLDEELATLRLRVKELEALNSECKWVDEALKKAQGSLEHRVEERTAELYKINEELKREIADRKRIEDKLRRSEASLANAQKIARLGSWQWSLKDKKISCSDEAYRIFGYTPSGCGISYKQFLQAVHPDDRELVQKTIAETLRSKKGFDIDYRIVLPDGTERMIVHEKGETTFDSKGKPAMITGTVQDITARKRVEMELRQSKDVADETNRAKSAFLALPCVGRIPLPLGIPIFLFV